MQSACLKILVVEMNILSIPKRICSMTLKQFLTDILHFPSKQYLGLHFKDFWISKNYRAPTFSAELSNQIGKKNVYSQGD